MIARSAGEEVKSRILLRRFGAPIDVAYTIWFLASRTRTASPAKPSTSMEA
jgi:NAD(P)-dependent dehydrogenase (short-subunit alcohol dehydrogenase family)